MTTRNAVTILIADDDAEDILLARDALAEARLANDLRVVSDGQELLDYLRREGRFSDPATAPRPGLILLDLNMPKMDGRTALREIKGDASLRQIPVVILTTSQADEDIVASYDLGVNSYIRKPVSFAGLVEVMQSLKRYWFEIVELPHADGRHG
ncbi:response regulator [Pseudogemmatithrix spongiicola]|uniref:Response regulator n=1 Tax=Pseudogemmatithrix spongiicola TaxID=3062599 RepID=A0AA49JTR9_9BACT|nr:response regulator [Gemmatimonadaceae bacterium 'strain 138']WKW14642.1 response regulator [Gemmatimonadaceae bacterium 'strain 318']